MDSAADPPPGARAARALLLGVGNDLLGDDGVGLYVVRAVRERLGAQVPVDVEEAYTAGFDLVEYLRGYARAVIVDAVKTEGGVPGTIYKMDAADLRPTAHLARIHGINLAGALAIAEQLQIPMPKDIVVIAVEAAELTTFREELTPLVATAVEEAARMVLAELGVPSELMINKDG